MKTILIFLSFMVIVSLPALAGGTVNWTSPSAGVITIQTNSSQFSPLWGGGSTGVGSVGDAQGSIALGTGFYFSLLYQTFTGVQAPPPMTLAQLSTWSDSGLEGTNNNNVNFPGRLVAIGPNTAATVPWNSGTTDSIIVVIWSQNLGSTFASALANMESYAYSGPAYFGESATGYISPFSDNPGANIFGNAPTSAGLPIGNSLDTQLYLLPVPEPATIALAAVGTFSLLALRRRR
jgi:hypothetical protein